MKTIKILIVIIFLMGIIGCENNPINPVETDEKDSVYASVMIVQDYGYCDSTGCYGESVLLYTKDIDDWVMVFENFNTQDYYRIINGVKYSTAAFILFYDTNTECTLDIIGTNNGICFIKKGSLKIDLNYNTNYNILWGINN